MKHKWLWWTKEDVRTELRQIEEEGRVVDAVQAEFDRLLAPEMPEDEAFQGAVNALLDWTIRLPTRRDYPYCEPSDLAGIRARRPDGPRTLPVALDAPSKRDRIAGAWLGRCAGCLLGKPIEGVRSPGLQALLERSGQHDLTDYLWRLPGLREQDYRELGFEALLKNGIYGDMWVAAMLAAAIGDTDIRRIVEMGLMLGAQSLPSKWTGVMNDTIHTGLSGYHVSKISDLAGEMYRLHVKAENTRP